jgi:hypothetical protein
MLSSCLALVSQTCGRPSTSPQVGAKLDLQSKPVNDFIELLLRHHTPVDVTLGTCEGIFTGRPGQASPDLVVLKRPPQQVQPGTDGIKELGPIVEGKRADFRWWRQIRQSTSAASAAAAG